MRRSLFQGFQFEIILYTLLSLLFTVFTEGGVIGISYLIMRALRNNNAEPSEKIQEYLYSNSKINMTINNLDKPESESGALGNMGRGFYVFTAILLLMIALILFITYFLLLTKKFSTYLEEITKGIYQLSTGDFETRIEVKNDNELTDIAMKLNKMAEDIKTIMDNERKVETKKNDLITNVAHDLRTPLTSIIGYLDLVSNKNMVEEVRSKYIKIAYSKSKRLEKLIDDLFTYTKLDFGELKPVCIEVDIVKMLEQMIEEFYPSFQENNIEHQFIAKERSIRLLADGGLLGRAFANLVGNAIKYGADGKNIIIEVSRDGDTAIVAITNFGEIIPKDALENVFNKFYRVDNSRNLTTGGTGLGLAIAKNIVCMHEGNITVKSDFKGTVFKVGIPIRNS